MKLDVVVIGIMMTSPCGFCEPKHDKIDCFSGYWNGSSGCFAFQRTIHSRFVVLFA